jgi:outer membrane biosynthesis protein TonB
MKAISKLQGRERGPYKVISRDAHNNITVDVDGTPMPFNIQQVEPAPTLIPVVRRPPTYKGGSLEYQPEMEEEIDHKKPTTPPKTRSKAKESQHPASQKAKHMDRKEKHSSTPEVQQSNKTTPSPQSSTGGRKSHHRQFSIIRDTVMGQNYACEILQGTAMNEVSEVHLYAKAKKGNFQPIWYDPEDLLSDPPRSKACPTCPEGWSPWLQPIEEGWKILIDPETTLSKLKRHKLL